MICPKCGENIILKKGKFGYFYSCEGFPNCNYTQDYIRSEEDTKIMIDLVINQYKNEICKELKVSNKINILLSGEDIPANTLGYFISGRHYHVQLNSQYPFRSKYRILHTLAHELYHYKAFLNNELLEEEEVPYKYKQNETLANEFADNFLDSKLF